MTSTSQEHEFYPTPDALAAYLWSRLLWAIPDATLRYWAKTGDPIQCLEPSAGRGAFARAMSAASADHGVEVTAIEPYVPEPGDLPENISWAKMTLEDLHASLCEYEDPADHAPFDIACGNPPFSLAEEHLRILLKIVRRGGYVAFLLRSGFLGSSGRAQFFAVFPPKHVFILSRRPSFVWSHCCKNGGCRHSWTTAPGSPAQECPECGGSGDVSTSKTDRYDYAFCVWEVGWTGPTTMSWLTHIPEGTEQP